KNESKVPSSWIRSLDRFLPLWERHHADASPRSQRWLKARALELLKAPPPKEDWQKHCERMERRWSTAEHLFDRPLDLDEAVCSCVRMSDREKKLSRVGSLKLLYQRAIQRNLSCIHRKGSRG
ncbi:MAG: hypothetical protein AAFQ82_14890, partial [Myxococcota bacterium]